MNPYQTSRDGNRETQMVTGDLNAALVEWVVQYRISDPVKFLFDVREPRGTLRDVSESVMREVVGDRTVDEVITIGRQEIESEALTKMQALRRRRRGRRDHGRSSSPRRIRGRSAAVESASSYKLFF